MYDDGDNEYGVPDTHVRVPGGSTFANERPPEPKGPPPQLDARAAAAAAPPLFDDPASELDSKPKKAPAGASKSLHGGALPPGWKAVASRSLPGEFAFKNVYTGERISWTPQHPAERVDGKSLDLDPNLPNPSRSHSDAGGGGKSGGDKGKGGKGGKGGGKVHTGSGLPDGWIAVPSRSRPGVIVYKNKHTGEKISWVPKNKASKTSGKSVDLNPPDSSSEEEESSDDDEEDEEDSSDDDDSASEAAAASPGAEAGLAAELAATRAALAKTQDALRKTRRAFDESDDAQISAMLAKNLAAQQQHAETLAATIREKQAALKAQQQAGGAGAAGAAKAAPKAAPKRASPKPKPAPAPKPTPAPAPAPAPQPPAAAHHSRHDTPQPDGGTSGSYAIERSTTSSDGWGLPPGWMAVRSGSHKDQIVYKNRFTGEKISWAPTRPASSKEGQSLDICEPESSDEEEEDTDEMRSGGGGGGGGAGGLPTGWAAMPSSSRPGEYVYQNTFTGERIAWRPEKPASRIEGESDDLYA